MEVPVERDMVFIANGSNGTSRLQVDLYAKHSVPYPAFPSLRGGWEEAPRALPWAITAQLHLQAVSRT